MAGRNPGVIRLLAALIGGAVAATSPAEAGSLCLNICGGMIQCRYPLTPADRARHVGAVLSQEGTLGLFHERSRSRSGQVRASENDRQPGDVVTLKTCAVQFDSDDEIDCRQQTIEYMGYFPCVGAGDPAADCLHNPQEPGCH